MSEKMSYGSEKNPEAHAEPESQPVTERQLLDDLSPEEAELVIRRIDALDPRDPDYVRKRYFAADDALKDILLRRKHSEGERK